MGVLVVWFFDLYQFAVNSQTAAIVVSAELLFEVIDFYVFVKCSDYCLLRALSLIKHFPIIHLLSHAIDILFLRLLASSVSEK